MSRTQRETAAGYKTAIVSAVDEGSHRVRVELPDLDGLETGWLIVLATKTLDDKEYWLPDVGEQVAVLLDNQGEDGCVLGAVYSDVDTVPVASKHKWHRRFKDGSTFEYDRELHRYQVVIGASQVKIDRDEVRLESNGSTYLMNGDQIRLESNGSTIVMDGAGVRVNGKRVDLN